MALQLLAHQVDLAHAGHEDQRGFVLAGRLLGDAPVKLPRPRRAPRLRRVLDIQGIGHRLCGVDGRAHELGKALRVDRGGHGDDAEVFAQLGQFQAHAEH